MIASKRLCCRHAAAVALITLVVGWGATWAEQDQFTVDIRGQDIHGEGRTPYEFASQAEPIPPGGEGSLRAAPVEHLGWSQPPIEKDPRSKRLVYCGWGELAYATRPLSYAAAAWTFVADDFRCPGDLPITLVHWWGSYQGWNGDEAPHAKPESWRIGFWGNAPADQRYPFSRPSKLLWVINVPSTRVEEEKAGNEGFPQMPPDTVFRYLLKLQPQECFRPDLLPASDTQDHLFWISITAVYAGAPEPQNPWGWLSRPKPWAGGALRAQFKRDELRAGFSLDASTVHAVTSLMACERQAAYDMAFELATGPEYVRGEQPFTGIHGWANYEDEESLAVEDAGAAAKWTQSPDTTTTGCDVDVTRDSPVTWPAAIAADDFECRTTEPITGITLWTAWYQDALPGDSADNVTFTLSIRQDIPGERSTTKYGMPGKVLWRKQFSRGQFTIEPVESRAEGYYSPANETFERNNHVAAYKYSFKIDPSEAFQQTGTEKDPVVYWLAVQARVVHTPGSMATRLGWQTSTNRWHDGAVWVKAEESYDGAAWKPANYPKGHFFGGKPIDLAFTVETQKSATGTAVRRMIADDWVSRSDLPVTGVVWWGSYLRSGYLPCECLTPAGSARPEPAGPQPPDYFLLSIWADVPASDGKDTKSFSHPGTKIWEYKAEKFDEVLVGFDKDPPPTSSSVQGFEPVYRYAVSLPQDQWFRPHGPNSVYWLSVVAVYRDAKSMNYPWGWTNHPSVSWDQQTAVPKPDEMAGKVAADRAGRNGDAVAAQLSTSSAGDTWNWTPLLDQTGRTEDMSFLLWTEPSEASVGDVFVGTDPNDGSVEIVIPSRPRK